MGTDEPVPSSCCIILPSFYLLELLLKYFVNCMKKSVIAVLIIFAAKSYNSSNKPWLHQIQQPTTGKDLGDNLPEESGVLEVFLFYFVLFGVCCCCCFVLSFGVLFGALANCCRICIGRS